MTVSHSPQGFTFYLKAAQQTMGFRVMQRRSIFSTRRPGLAIRQAREKRKRIDALARRPAVRLMRMKRMFPRIPLNSEAKYYDLNYGAAIATTADCTGAEADPTTILCLNGVPQGDTMTTRDGQKITMKSIFVQGLVNLPSQTAQSAAEQDCTIFVAMVLDTQTNKAQLNSEDVYENTRSGTDAFLLAQPFRKMNFTERFKVLATKTITFPPPPITNNASANTIVQAGVKVPFTLFAKLNGLGTKFDTSATTGAIGTIIDNSIHIIAFANNADYAPSLYYQSRLRFFDR